LIIEKLATYSKLDRKLKWKGVLDYRVIIFVLIYFVILYNILKALNISMLYTIYFLILSFIPVLGVYFTVNDEDNIIELITNILSYIFKPKVYVYKYKNSEESYTLYKSRKVLVVKANNKWYNLKSILKG